MALPLHTVIIHGWSDCSKSFEKVKRFLAGAGVGAVSDIYFADYESREDEITYDDVVDGLNDEFKRLKFVGADGRALVDLNVVVHSTGGLVIRYWIERFYLRAGRPVAECPVRRIVMLAPANFGSPLAHRGKSFLGQAAKGRWQWEWGNLREVGAQMLDGLELGSPLQWNLAHGDLVPERGTPYTARDIQVTVLVGIDDYDGFRGWVNKPGTDGTVVIAGTGLNTLKLTLDCTGPSSAPYAWTRRGAAAEVAFGVLPGMHHGSIVDGAADERAGKYVVRALKARGDEEFRGLVTDLREVTKKTYRDEEKPAYQQFLVHAVDEAGNAIRDFTLEFFIREARTASSLVVVGNTLSKQEDELSRLANRALTAEGHEHTRDPSHRRFLVDVAAVKVLMRRARAELGASAVLSMRVYVPDSEDDGIRYRTENLKNIVLQRSEPAPDEPSFLFENTTTLLELRVDRCCDLVTVGLEARKH